MFMCKFFQLALEASDLDEMKRERIARKDDADNEESNIHNDAGEDEE